MLCLNLIRCDMTKFPDKLKTIDDGNQTKNAQVTDADIIVSGMKVQKGKS